MFMNSLLTQKWDQRNVALAALKKAFELSAQKSSQTETIWRNQDILRFKKLIRTLHTSLVSYRKHKMSNNTC